MYLQSTRHLLALLLALSLAVCPAKGYASSSHSRAPQRPSVATDLSRRPSELPLAGQRPTQDDSVLQRGGGEEEEEDGRRRRERCEEGWLHTHHHCLLDTGLGAGHQAELFCSQYGALEARGICIKQAPVSGLSSLEPAMTGDDEDQKASPSSSSSSSSSSPGSQTSFLCPSGWSRYGEFCLFKPDSIPKVCELLGANYMFNYCVTRVPHKVPVDFVRTVKRLEGSDYDLQRDTRLCCCGGRHLCK